MPQPGQVDLAVVKRAMIKDAKIIPDSFTADGENYLPNDWITLTAKVKNQGDVALKDLTVTFYDGNPDEGGAQIASVNIEGWLKGHTETTVSAQWIVPEPAVTRTLYVIADPDNTITEFSETNNRASATVGGSDLAVTYISSTVTTDGSMQVYAQIRNTGTTITPATTLSIREEGTDTAVATTSVPQLLPGSLAQVALYPSSEIVQGESFYTLVLDDDPAFADDMNSENDSSRFGISYTSHLTGISGDVNNDGQVDLKDVLALLKVITGVIVPEFHLKQADVCQSGLSQGKADMLDGILLMQYAAGLHSSTDS